VLAAVGDFVALAQRAIAGTSISTSPTSVNTVLGWLPLPE
jgi:hypothetical protein